MQDYALILRKIKAIVTYDQYGVTTTQSADAAVTEAGFTVPSSNYFTINNTNQIPYRGLFVVIDVPGVSFGGGFTTTGSPTAVNLGFTTTFSDDNTNPIVAAEMVSKQVVLSVTANAGTAPGRLYYPLPWLNHKGIKIVCAVTFTGGSAQTLALGPVGVALVQLGDFPVTGTLIA